MVDTADLGQYLLFEGLPPELLKLVANCLVPRTVPADTIIFSRGEPPTRFVLVQSGRVKVYSETLDGQKQVLSFFEAGETFAEAAMFLPAYPATARTMTECQLLFVARNDFQQLLGDHPELAMRMIVGLSLKQKKFLRVIEDLSLRDARGRLCHYLSRLSREQGLEGNGGIDVPVSQSNLAEMLGVTEETLSRTIRSLLQDGVLAGKAKGRIDVADMRRLREAYAL